MKNYLIRTIGASDPITPQQTGDMGDYQLEVWKHITEKLFLKLQMLEVIDLLLDVYAEVSDIQFKMNTGFYVYDEGLVKPIKQQSEFNIVKKGSGITSKINEKISILQIAKEYGLKLHGDKAICPFHNDTDPSLTFNPSRNTFKCWSSNCEKSGNLIDFIYECEQVGLVRRKE